MGWMFGAGLGMLMGGPLGAVIGGAFQHYLGKGTQGVRPQSSPHRRDEAVFVTYLATIMTKIAMADGRVDPGEVKTIHRFFERELGFSGMDLRFIDALIDQTRRVNPDLGQIALSFRSVGNREQTLLLMDICYRIAMADGKITVSEQKELDFLASHLGVNREEHQRIKNRYRAGEYKTSVQDYAAMDDYTALGISRSASNDEIKKAYRQMASQYHPDKVSHLGKELIDFANKKFKEITGAYENVKKERGFV
ncbi:MAG: co-chaperone protein DjlA [bacterium]|nr:MAG: co-chaperone protein DjlA [bacterium]